MGLLEAGCNRFGTEVILNQEAQPPVARGDFFDARQRILLEEEARREFFALFTRGRSAQIPPSDAAPLYDEDDPWLAKLSELP